MVFSYIVGGFRNQYLVELPEILQILIIIFIWVNILIFDIQNEFTYDIVKSFSNLCPEEPNGLEIAASYLLLLLISPVKYNDVHWLNVWEMRRYFEFWLKCFLSIIPVYELGHTSNGTLDNTYIVSCRFYYLHTLFNKTSPNDDLLVLSNWLVKLQMEVYK